MNERDEKNRAIAEWLEKLPRPYFEYHPERDTYSPGKAWLVRKGSLIVESRDFYTDEAANALVRDAMTQPHIWKNPNGQWTCEPCMDEECEVIESADSYMGAVANAGHAVALKTKEETVNENPI